jgi:hypothetical protein
MLRMISSRPAFGCPFRYAAQTLYSGSHLLSLTLFDYAEWRRERDWRGIPRRYAITFGAPSPLRSVETSHPSFAAQII